MELMDLKRAWFAEALSMPPETSLYDLEVLYFSGQAELPPETALYDLKRAYYAAQMELPADAPLHDLEVAFLAWGTELPAATPLHDLEVEYYSPPSLPPILILDGWIDAGAYGVEVMYEVNVACSGSFMFGEAAGGEVTFHEDGCYVNRADTGLSPETEYAYTLELWAEGYSGLVAAGTFVTTAA